MSGGYKKDRGKLRYDLIPTGPLEQLAFVYTLGSEKYSDHNWRQGMAWSRVIGAMMRHVEAFRKGISIDPVDGQHVLASVAWCAFTLMEYEKTHPELDDRPLPGRDIAKIESIRASEYRPKEETKQ
jgi:hypothetical protein